MLDLFFELWQWQHDVELWEITKSTLHGQVIVRWPWSSLQPPLLQGERIYLIGLPQRPNGLFGDSERIWNCSWGCDAVWLKSCLLFEMKRQFGPHFELEYVVITSVMLCCGVFMCSYGTFVLWFLTICKKSRVTVGWTAFTVYPIHPSQNSWCCLMMAAV